MAKQPTSFDDALLDKRRLRSLRSDLLAARNATGFRLHPLKGDRAGQWSVRVSGNWRVVFRFEDDDAVDVDLVDYH